jgi:SAM-dependent methyltransferase
MRYSDVQAARYASIVLEGSTFAVSLFPAISSMGDLTGTTVLDFGTGTGRSARALKDAGANRVVGVDKDENMLRVARRYPGVAYLQVGRTLPIRDRSMGAAFCANVFSEFARTDDIVSVCRQVWRVLDVGGVFVVVVLNPASIHCDYVSHRYINVGTPKSGDPITCRLKGAESILVQDYYWTVDDYINSLKAAGFEIYEILLPIADKDDGHWQDETRVAPDLVIRSKRVDL